MGDEEVQEAAWTANFTVGTSTLLYGVAADHETFMQELNAAVEHIKKSAQE